MNRFAVRHRTIFQLITIVFIAIVASSCENKISIIPKSDLLTLPSLTGKNIESVLTDSGKIQLILTSPLMERYATDFPYTEFKNGIKVVFWDGKKAPVGSVTSKYAKYTQTNNIWELKDSVVVINENGDKLETEVLNWNQATDLIYTDRFVKISSEDQITHAYGFESDSHLNNRKLKKVQAIIYIPDEK
jgi:LPS export ABC transporter protein LptC